MAYIAKPAGTYIGVYEYLREQVSRSADPRLMAAVRAGEPVRVPGYVLPAAVRQSAAYQQATRGVGQWGHPIRRAVMATVHVDGRIVYEAETAADWMSQHLPEDLADWRDPKEG